MVEGEADDRIEGLAAFEQGQMWCCAEGDAVEGGDGAGLGDVQFEVFSRFPYGACWGGEGEVVEQEGGGGVLRSVWGVLTQDVMEARSELVQVGWGVIVEDGLELVWGEVLGAIGFEGSLEMGQLAFVQCHSRSVGMAAELDEVRFACF